MSRIRVTNESSGRAEDVYETNREKKEMSKSFSRLANDSYTSLKSTNWSGRLKAAKANCLIVSDKWMTWLTRKTHQVEKPKSNGH